MSQDVVVIGGSGYIGQHIVGYLARMHEEKGIPHRVVATTHTQTAVPFHAGVDVRSLDISDESRCRSLLSDVRPSVVINCAAVSSLKACEEDPERAEQVNCPRGLLEAVAEEEHCWLFHFSTDIVFDGTSGPYNESSEKAPVNVYGRTKAKFDDLVRERLPDRSVILRPTNVVGEEAPFLPRHSDFLHWLEEKLRDTFANEMLYRLASNDESLEAGSEVALPAPAGLSDGATGTPVQLFDDGAFE